MEDKDRALNTWKARLEMEELEAEREKKRRKVKLEENNFIQSQITHEAQQKTIRRQEQEKEAEEEVKREEEQKQVAPEQKYEEKHQMEEADAAISMFGFQDGVFDEQTCHKMIDDLVSGKVPSLPEKKPNSTPELISKESDNDKNLESGEDSSIAMAEEIPTEIRAVMIGHALKNFARYAASEVPLSEKHVEVSRLCSNILKRATQQNITPAQMGLTLEERTAIQGTIHMGDIVKAGLKGKEVLLDPASKFLPERELHMRNFLTLKALEQALLPHIKGHNADILKGEGPLSFIQVLLGSPGFSAKEMHAMVGKTDAMQTFLSKKHDKVIELLDHDNREMDELGRLAITSCYDGSLKKAKGHDEISKADVHHIKPHVLHN